MTRRVLLLVFPAGWTSGQTREEKGRAVMAKMLEALGGERFVAMKDRVETGRVYSFYREQLRGLSKATISTRYVTAPDPPAPGELYVRERQSFGRKDGKEDWAVLFDEHKGWEITFRGARPMPADNIARYRETTRHNILYLLRQRRGEPGLTVEHTGTAIYDNQPMDVIEIVGQDNVPVKVHVHQSTHLPVKQAFIRRDPKSRERFEEETVFGKYRDAGGGVQWPYSITRHRNGEKVYEIFSESVTVNAGLTDELFTLQGKTKILEERR
jgi:hypothetical protein